MTSFTGQEWDKIMSSYSALLGQEDKAKVESNELFMTYKNLLERKTGLHWHANYLHKYMLECIIPFGLRIKLFPHFRNPSQEFKNKWEETLTNCSLSLMSLLITKHRAELNQVDKELLIINASLASFNTMEGYADKEKNIGENIARLSKQTITTKEKKLICDRKAFAGNKAYIWPNTQFSKPRRTPTFIAANPQNADSQNVEVLYSDSSASASSLSSAPSSSTRTFKQVRKHQKPHNVSPTVQKRCNTNEHLGDPSILTSQGVGNVITFSNAPSNSPKNTNFLSNPLQGTIHVTLDNIVVNLSTQQLTRSETEVLALGLDFCPETNLDIFKTIFDLNLFVRKLSLRALHHRNEPTNTGVNSVMQLTMKECRELRNLLLEDELTSSISHHHHQHHCWPQQRE